MKTAVYNLLNTAKPVKPIYLITIAGFENRVTQSLLALREWYGKDIEKIVIVDYPDTNMNEPNRSLLIKEAKRFSFDCEVMNSDIFYASYQSLFNDDKFTYLFDISGATREQIFKILNMLIETVNDFNIIYTEAEKYYPPESLYKELTKAPHNLIPTLDDVIENEDVIYSKSCTIVSPEGFTGNIEHGRMSLLIGFLTFKRSRLKCILDEIEFPVKIFIVGKPNRHDLQWRKDLLSLINYDNIAQATGEIIELETLCPVSTFSKLVDIAFENDRYFKYNIYLAPLGSKMQTVGAFFFWNYFKSTAIIFSKPYKYFPGTFSEGARGTFVINKKMMMVEIDNILNKRNHCQPAF